MRMNDLTPGPSSRGRGEMDSPRERAKNIVTGQAMLPGMKERNRELRRTMTPGERIL